MSPWLGIIWLLLLGLSGCAHSKRTSRVNCSETQQSTWRHPADWLRHTLSVEQAQEIIEVDLGATISAMQTDAVLHAHAEAWQAMYNEAEIGGQLWLMDAPSETLSPRGIVLIRDCEMVSTFITLES